MKKRTFSKEDKLRILKEAEEYGVKVTLDNHGIYPAAIVNRPFGPCRKGGLITQLE